MSSQADREAQVQKLRKLFAASEVPNDPKAWDQAWVNSTTPWDANEPQPALMELLNGIHDKDTTALTLDGQQVPISKVIPSGEGKALIPGCGRGYDAKVFAERGFTSFGVDISTTAVAAANKWLSEQSLAEGMLQRINFVEADFFALGTSSNPHPELSKPSAFDLAYDYTFLCAIPPALRHKWAETYTRLVKSDGILISLVYPIQGDRPGGPPFSLSTDLVRELLGSQNKQDGSAAWKELADLEPKNSKETRVGIERVMVWRRL